jgi:hypothetical protein
VRYQRDYFRRELLEGRRRVAADRFDTRNRRGYSFKIRLAAAAATADGLRSAQSIAHWRVGERHTTSALYDSETLRDDLWNASSSRSLVSKPGSYFSPLHSVVAAQIEL